VAKDRLDHALGVAAQGYWELDLATRTLTVSDLYKSNWGLKPEDPFSYRYALDHIHPDDLALHETAVNDALVSGILDVEYRNIWPDDSIHWVRIRGTTVYDGSGVPVQMAGTSFNATHRRRIEAALREETETLEILNGIGVMLNSNLNIEHVVQTVTDAATKLSGAQFGSFFHNVIDDNGESYLLWTLSGVPRSAFDKFPMPRNTAVFGPTFKGTGVIRSDDITKDPRYGKNAPYYGKPKGHLPVVSYLAVPVVSRSGEVLGGLFFGHEKPGVFTERAARIGMGIAAQAAIAMDNARLLKRMQNEVAERRRAERHLELLLAEVNHRVKNTLAVVMSIATNTLRHSRSVETFRNSFEARIMALAEAHNLLSEGNWEGTSLPALIDRAMKPYRGADEPRYSVDCDAAVRVRPKDAVTLVIAFNELATNATKYGALSRPDGRVAISCRLDGDRLVIRWQESGGPPVKPPTRQGFGTRLIKGLAYDLSASVDMQYERSGLICTMTMAHQPDVTTS
jgi:two-component sensor histidine kinase/PAS domain-containing protein